MVTDNLDILNGLLKELNRLIGYCKHLQKEFDEAKANGDTLKVASISKEFDEFAKKVEFLIQQQSLMIQVIRQRRERKLNKKLRQQVTN